MKPPRYGTQEDYAAVISSNKAAGSRGGGGFSIDRNDAAAAGSDCLSYGLFRGQNLNLKGRMFLPRRQQHLRFISGACDSSGSGS
jgi:hypothetical protein